MTLCLNLCDFMGLRDSGLLMPVSCWRCCISAVFADLGFGVCGFGFCWYMRGVSLVVLLFYLVVCVYV